MDEGASLSHIAKKPVLHQEKHGMEKRFPLKQCVSHFAQFPMPVHLNWMWTFGAILCGLLCIMVVTGLFLALTYVPTVAGAFASIEDIERHIPKGWLLRGLHLSGASLIMAALYMHFLRGFYYESYKAPRELVWISGLVCIILFMIIAFAGYVLPWGQMSYWAADVVGQALGAVPVIGHTLTVWLQGGERPGEIYLHRLFVVHFLMAFIIIGLVVFHVAALHITGPSNPKREKESQRTLPFHPYFTIKDLRAFLVCLLICIVLFCFLPEWLTEVDNFRPANPFKTPKTIEPAWYFLPFYGILQAVPSKFGGLLAALGSFVVLLALPWLDKSPLRSAYQKIIFRIGISGIVLSFVLMGCAGKYHMEGRWLLIGRLALIYYFFFFLIWLPVESYVKRRSLPTQKV